MALSDFEQDVINHIEDEVIEPWYETKIKNGFQWDTVTLLLDALHKSRLYDEEHNTPIEDNVRKYIYENEKEVLKYCLEGRKNGDFSKQIFEQRMVEPVEFLNNIEKECAYLLINKTQLRNLKEFPLDKEHCDLIFNVLSNIEDNMRLMEKEEAFKTACYDIYRKQWLRDHNMSLNDEKEIIDTIYSDEHKDDATFTRADAKALYMMYEGIDSNGTIYASQSEFLKNEYLDVNTMHSILPKNFIELYDSFQCIPNSQIPKEENKIVALSDEKEKETLKYLQSLDLDKAVKQTFVKPFELLQKIGVDAEHMDACETLLQSTHFSRYNGRFSLVQGKTVPVTFDKYMKDDLAYTLKYFDKEKEFMKNEEEFKHTLFINYCQKTYGVTVATNTKHYSRFLKDVYTDSRRMQSYMNFNQRMLQDRYNGIPYKEKLDKTYFIQRGGYKDKYLWEAGKAWRDITQTYEGKDKQLLIDRVSQVTSRFRYGLDVHMLESGLVYNAGNVTDNGIKKLQEISKKYYGKIKENQKEIER